MIHRTKTPQTESRLSSFRQNHEYPNPSTGPFNASSRVGPPPNAQLYTSPSVGSSFSDRLDLVATESPGLNTTFQRETQELNLALKDLQGEYTIRLVIIVVVVVVVGGVVSNCSCCIY